MKALAGARVGAMFAAFGLVVIPHLLLTALGRRDVVPPPFLSAIGWLAGLRIRVEGRPLKERPLLLLGNHVSWLDILAMAGSARVAFVAKGELAGGGFVHWLCVQNDTLFVARKQGRHIAGQVDGVRALLARRRVAIFPEGTTGDGRELLPFKSTLLAATEGAAVAVQPVLLAYRDADEVAWVGDEPGIANVKRMLARTRPIHLTLRFLPPLEGEALADRKAMAAAAQAAIAEALSATAKVR